TGAQIVCPSPGNGREWVGGEPGEPAVVPFPVLWAAGCSLAEACGGKMPAVNGNPAKTGRRPGVTERAGLYLDKVPVAVSGEGGHDQTFHAACVVVKGFALPEHQAMEALRDWNARCKPPWTEAELLHKVRDADKWPDDRPRGYLRDAQRN